MRRRNATIQSCTQVDAKESGCRIRTRRSLTDLTAPRVQPKSEHHAPHHPDVPPHVLRQRLPQRSGRPHPFRRLRHARLEPTRLPRLARPELGKRAYALVPTLDGDLIGILFRQAEASPRSRAQCSWCQDVKLPNDVELRRPRARACRAAGAGPDDMSAEELAGGKVSRRLTITKPVPPQPEHEPSAPVGLWPRLRDIPPNGGGGTGVRKASDRLAVGLL